MATTATTRGRRWDVGKRGALLLTGLTLWAGNGSAQEVVELPARDRALTHGMEEVFRVGSLDGQVWETFGDVRQVAFDADGNLYVFDAQASRVVVVGSDGSLVREVGKAGDGPGELRMPVGMVVLPDGRLVVADMGHRAYAIFGRDGAYERSVSMGGDGGVIRLGDLHPDRAGRGLLAGGGNAVVMSMRGGPGEGPSLPDTRPVELLDLSGDVVSSRVLVEGWQPPRNEGSTTLEGGGVRLRAPGSERRTFEPDLYLGGLPDGGVAVADSSTWTVRVAGPEGTVERVLRRPFRPRPVTEAMKDAERERRLRELAEGEGPRMTVVTRTPGGGGGALSDEAVEEMLRGRIEAMAFYPELPVIMEMKAGWDGALWVQRRGERPSEPGPLDVVTPDGRYLGTFAHDALAMPDAFGPEGMVAFVEHDEFDVPTVVVRRLPPALR